MHELRAGRKVNLEINDAWSILFVFYFLRFPASLPSPRPVNGTRHQLDKRIFPWNNTLDSSILLFWFVCFIDYLRNIFFGFFEILIINYPFLRECTQSVFWLVSIELNFLIIIIWNLRSSFNYHDSYIIKNIFASRVISFLVKIVDFEENKGKSIRSSYFLLQLDFIRFILSYDYFVTFNFFRG